jgi:hypothetical protein
MMMVIITSRNNPPGEVLETLDTINLANCNKARISRIPLGGGFSTRDDNRKGSAIIHVKANTLGKTKSMHTQLP